jgi:membrane-associated phospholipid phosphatase
LHALWVFVTDCGDSAVTVPLALLTLVFLISAGQRRIALAWVLAIGGCAFAIAVLKLAFGACGQEMAIARIASPSGHTALSTAIFGSLALLVGATLSPGRRAALYFATAVALVGIAWSRLVLQFHDEAKIAIGFLVGVGGIVGFRAALRRQAAPALPLKWLVLCGAVLVVAMHRTRWMVEPIVHRLAWELRFVLPGCR